MADQPTPKYVVDDSKLKASISTVFSLVFFGITLAGALFAALSAHDINGVREILMRDATLQWLTTIAPFMWLAWRTVRSWFKKQRDNEIVDAADDTVAVRKSLLAEPVADPAPTRARETTTRLRDASVLGMKVEPVKANPFVVPKALEKLPVMARQFHEERDAIHAAISAAVDDLEAEPVPAMSLLSVAELHGRWIGGEREIPWPEYMREHGYAWDGSAWSPIAADPAPAAPRIAGDPLDLQPAPAKK